MSMQVQPPPEEVAPKKDESAEQEAVEKLKNADWNSPEKVNESSDQNYSMEGSRQRNIVHQKKGEGAGTGQSKSKRAYSQRTNKRIAKK